MSIACGILLLLLAGIFLGKNSSKKHTPKDNKDSVEVSVCNDSIIELIPTISIDSLAKLGIEVMLWAESLDDFESLHNIKLYRNKTVPGISFQSKEKIEFPKLWFEQKGKMELLLYSWNEGHNHLEYLLKNKDKKFVVIGSYNDKEFQGALFEYN